MRLVRVDWKRAESEFADMFYVKGTDAAGNEVRTPPGLGRVWNWLVDFLLADFQARASFLAGFALGLRLG